MSSTRTAQPARRARPARPVPAGRRISPVSALVAAILLLGLVAIFANRGGGSDGVPAGVEQVRAVTVSGAALPVLEDGADPAVGTASPTVEGQDFDGNPVAIGAGGTPKLIVFLAHWCPHCQKEVPVITDWLAANGAPAGVDLVSVSTEVSADLPNYPPSEWLEREDWPVPVLVDNTDRAVKEAFGVSGFPFFVAVDATGHVVARGSGELDTDALHRLVSLARGR